MKLCPLCSSTYADRVDFCFRDGTPLVRDGAGGEIGARSDDLPTPESDKPYRDDTFDTEVLFDPDTGSRRRETLRRKLDERGLTGSTSPPGAPSAVADYPTPLVATGR